MKRLFFLIAAAATLAGSGPLFAQIPLATRPAPWKTGARELPSIVSPEVLPGNKITFRLLAPDATKVGLDVGTSYSDEGKYDLKKGADGVWSVTIGPVPPELYPYFFIVDGARVNLGLVDVPGAETRFYETQNVPHGAITINTYTSASQKMQRKLWVYTPPQYPSAPKRAFPVLYLWCVGQDDVTNHPIEDASWMPQWGTNRRAGDILDNLIAARKATPMIVVMMQEKLASKLSTASPAGQAILSKEVADEIIPFVDAHYRTLATRENRAMAGASTEGGAAYDTATANLDKFGSLGLFGTGMFGGLIGNYAPFNPDQVLPGVTQKMKAPATPVKLLYFSAGTLDPREPFVEKAVGEFQKYGVKPVFHTFAGGHQDKVWRHSLADFATLVFK